MTGATASRILFRRGTSPLVATGVEFLVGDEKYTVDARKEVILSAGESAHDNSSYLDSILTNILQVFSRRLRYSSCLVCWFFVMPSTS